MTTAEVIEGTAREVEPESALVVADPARGLAVPETPTAMVALAAQMATALKDIVERQKLYAVIQGKKYPQVEAWMTVARMDNVVAREVGAVRHEDGGYEATVELLRLSDGLVIGRGSALCGSPDDRPWCTRPEYARRSMAVTRATSRALRLHYSWIMALAGYEPTPADEMPPELHDRPQQPTTATQRPAEAEATFTGTVAVGKPPVDCEMRQTPDGPALGFSLALERGKVQVLATGALATTLGYVIKATIGKPVTVWGRLEMVPWQDRDGKQMPPFRRLHLARIQTPDETIPGTPAATPADDIDGLVW